MRLTEKYFDSKELTIYSTSGANVLEIPDIIEGHKYLGNSIDKLGQLEDWEEKIEMPLIKFLEWRIENKLPYCIIEGKIKKVAHYSWLMERNIIEVWDANLKKRYRFHFRDYGKNWALTKDELL